MSGRYIVKCEKCDHINYHEPVKGAIGRRPFVDPTLSKSEKSKIYRQNHINKKKEKEKEKSEDGNSDEKKNRQMQHITDYYKKKMEKCLI